MAISLHENDRLGGPRVKGIVSGAGDGARTRDPLLGKQMLYHCDEHEDDWPKFETGLLLADLGTDFTAESASPRYFFAVSSRY